MTLSSESPSSAETPLVELRGVTCGYADRIILRDVSLTVPRGAVIGLMGTSGGGKTTVLRLIGRQLDPIGGTVLFDGVDLATLDREALYAVRRRMGMLFQFGALFTDLSVFDNVAFPLREHTSLSEPMVRDLVLMKLNAVGLRGARELMPSQVSGGMARRVALARAIALDPDLIMYDEPFAGLDPISMGMASRLIRDLNQALGVTSIVVSHDVEETFAIADHIVFIANGAVAAQGTPQDIRDSTDPLVRQFFTAAADGPVQFHYPALPVAQDFGLESQGGAAVIGRFGPAAVGAATRERLEDIGAATRLFGRLLALSGTALKRFSLVVEQLFFVGNRSLSIIAVSGLFVGFVLALQGYYTLQRYGSAEAVGLLVALSLVRELGPVVTALLFAGRAGTSLTAEIGLMKAGEQLAAMEMMAVDPVLRVLAPRFWGGVFAMPLLAAVFSAVGVLGGWLVAVPLIGIDAGAFWSQMQGGVDVFADVGNGIVKSAVFGVTVTFVALLQGYECKPTPEGVSQATTRTVVMASLAVLGLDFVLTAMMFSI